MVGMPLPLQSQFGRIKFIAGLRDSQVTFGFARFCMMRYRLADALFILRPDERPAFVPFDWLQVNNSPVSLSVLEMHTPPLAVSGIHQSSLVRAIHRSTTAFQYDLIFVGSED